MKRSPDGSVSTQTVRHVRGSPFRTKLIAFKCARQCKRRTALRRGTRRGGELGRVRQIWHGKLRTRSGKRQGRPSAILRIVHALTCCVLLRFRWLLGLDRARQLHRLVGLHRATVPCCAWRMALQPSSEVPGSSGSGSLPAFPPSPHPSKPFPAVLQVRWPAKSQIAVIPALLFLYQITTRARSRTSDLECGGAQVSTGVVPTNLTTFESKVRSFVRSFLTLPTVRSFVCPTCVNPFCFFKSAVLDGREGVLALGPGPFPLPDMGAANSQCGGACTWRVRGRPDRGSSRLPAPPRGRVVLESGIQQPGQAPSPGETRPQGFAARFQEPARRCVADAPPRKGRGSPPPGASCRPTSQGRAKADKSAEAVWPRGRGGERFDEGLRTWQ